MTECIELITLISFYIDIFREVEAEEEEEKPVQMAISQQPATATAIKLNLDGQSTLNSH